MKVLYSLFEKRPEGWCRISDYAYGLRTAQKVYQGRLLEPSLSPSTAPYERRLKKVETKRS